MPGRRSYPTPAHRGGIDTQYQILHDTAYHEKTSAVVGEVSMVRMMLPGPYRRLGVRPVVNARGVNTMAGGALMPPAVLEAMVEAATSFVDMAELNAKAGARIAEL